MGVLGVSGDVLPLGDQDGGGPGGGQRAASDGARGAGQQQWGIKEAESAGRKGRQIEKANTRRILRLRIFGIFFSLQSRASLFFSVLKIIEDKNQYKLVQN